MQLVVTQQFVECLTPPGRFCNKQDAALVVIQVINQGFSRMLGLGL